MPSRYYRIRVSPALEAAWSARFEGLSLTSIPGSTELSGVLVDQAALHGVLARIRDLGLTLLAIDSHDLPTA